MTNWRKYIWQIIGTLLALAAVIATYDVFFRSKPVKELQIILDSSTPLVDVKPEASQDIEIYYQGQQVQNIYLIQLSIKNTGNQPIVESDYSKNLLLMLNTEAKIVDASKVSSEPPNIEPSIVISSRNYVEFSPFLMNPGDILTVKILAIAPTNSSMDVKVDGRIAGVKELEIIAKSDITPLNITYITAIIGTVTALLSGLVSLMFEVKSIKLSIPFWTEIVFSRKSKREKPNQKSGNNE